MTYEEALKFFAEFSGICPDVERLRGSMPTPKQLVAVVDQAVTIYHQPKELAQEAALAITNQMELMEEPKNHTMVRGATVEHMIQTWEKGEVYTFPYTRAEVKAAEQRWVAEKRKCASAPNRLPWAIQRGAK